MKNTYTVEYSTTADVGKKSTSIKIMDCESPEQALQSVAKSYRDAGVEGWCFVTNNGRCLCEKV